MVIGRPLLENPKIQLKNVRTNEDEVEGGKKDLKGLRKDVEKLIASKPASDDRREHFEAIYKDEIAKSSDFSQIEDFYWQFRSGYESVNDFESDSDSSVDLY